MVKCRPYPSKNIFQNDAGLTATVNGRRERTLFGKTLPRGPLLFSLNPIVVMALDWGMLLFKPGMLLSKFGRVVGGCVSYFLNIAREAIP